MLKINDAFSLNQDLQRCEDKKESRAITVKDFAFSRWRDRILRILCEKKKIEVVIVDLLVVCYYPISLP